MVEVRFTLPFQRRLKSLRKRYRSIKQDIEPILAALENGSLIGDQIPGSEFTALRFELEIAIFPRAKAAGIG